MDRNGLWRAAREVESTIEKAETGRLEQLREFVRCCADAANKEIGYAFFPPHSPKSTIATETALWRRLIAINRETTKIIRKARRFFSKTMTPHVLVIQTFPSKAAKKWNRMALLSGWRDIAATGLRYDTRRPFRPILVTDRGHITVNLSDPRWRDFDLTNDFCAEIISAIRKAKKEIDSIALANDEYLSETRRIVGLLSLIGSDPSPLKHA